LAGLTASHAALAGASDAAYTPCVLKSLFLGRRARLPHTEGCVHQISTRCTKYWAPHPRRALHQAPSAAAPGAQRTFRRFLRSAKLAAAAKDPAVIALMRHILDVCITLINVLLNHLIN